MGLGAEAEVVDVESYRRWFLVHVLGAYYMTAVVLFLLWKAYEEYLQLRHAFRQRPAPENCAWARLRLGVLERVSTPKHALTRIHARIHHPHQTDTVMVHHIPGAMRSNAAIAAYFEALFPGSVKKARKRICACMPWRMFLPPLGWGVYV